MAKTLTLAEIIAQYGLVPLSFSSYYKYRFTFRGIAEDGAVISASLGGIPDDIYREEVTAEEVRTLGPSPKDDWSLIIVNMNGEEVFSWDDPY